MEALLTGIIIWILGGVGAVVLSRFPRWASTSGAAAAVLGALLGLPPTVRVLLHGGCDSLQLPWDAVHGRFLVELDALGAVFLLPILALTVLAAVYGAQYLLAYRDRKSLGVPWFFFNAFVAGMTLVVLARTVLLFVVAWEVMSLSAFFLVTFEHEEVGVRRAGWVYLVATHLGLTFLLTAFLLLGNQAGSLEFAAFHAVTLPSATLAGVVFVLALVGFGAKAGIVPFHVWLPEAHPAAPSHVSALMSGVMIKMGLYGLLRVLTFLGPPVPWWGMTLAVSGMLTALVGISLAVCQRDIKRVLAYSSIENMGLITLSLGIGFWGQATQRPLVATLGLAGGLLHMWNHAVMKSLMFLAAGSVLHATGTRDLEQLGGLMRRLPWTARTMTLGAVAIAALPPLNGFASKWLMYLALLHTGLAPLHDHGLTALLAVGLLALVGGLAAVAFARLIGIALLGSPRSAAADHAHESSLWMVIPLGLLAAACLVLALLPGVALDGVAQALLQLQGSPHAATSPRVAADAGVPGLRGSVQCLAVGGRLVWSRRCWRCWPVRRLARPAPPGAVATRVRPPACNIRGSRSPKCPANGCYPAFCVPAIHSKRPQDSFPHGALLPRTVPIRCRKRCMNPCSRVGHDAAPNCGFCSRGK